jgi:hypothetical protein
VTGYLLLFSDYSSSGNNISYTTLPTSPVSGEIVKNESTYLISRFKSQPSGTKSYADQVYTPVPYRKWKNLFRFHSWMPFYADIERIQDDPTSIKPGLTLMSQNNLSTLISSFGYEYSDQRHKIHSSIKWFGWYPVFESRIDYGNSIYVEKFRENVADPADIINGYEWTNTLSLPLSPQH